MQKQPVGGVMLNQTLDEDDDNVDDDQARSSCQPVPYVFDAFGKVSSAADTTPSSGGRPTRENPARWTFSLPPR